MAVAFSGDLPDDSPAAEDPAGAPPRRRRRRSRTQLGMTAFGLAAVLALSDVAAILLATAGDWTTGTLLGVMASVLTILSLALGLAAIVLHRGRAWGLAAAILSIVANPWLLTRILSFFAQF